MGVRSVTSPAAKSALTGDAPVIRDDIGPELVSEINFVRTKPAQYAEMLRKDRLPHFRRACACRLPPLYVCCVKAFSSLAL